MMVVACLTASGGVTVPLSLDTLRAMRMIRGQQRAHGTCYILFGSTEVDQAKDEQGHQQEALADPTDDHTILDTPIPPFPLPLAPNYIRHHIAMDQWTMAAFSNDCVPHRI
ncbi:hypothetical protein DsansV1_C14g0131081 [Dioscorea sansibarensis]